MTIIRNKPYALLLIGLMTINGCALKQMIKMSKDEQLTVAPNPIEVHGDSVKFEMSAVLPLKMLKKNKIYNVATSYKYGDQAMALGDIEFRSVDYPNAKTVQPKITKSYSFGYTPEIGNGDVIVQGTAYNLAKSKNKKTAEMPVAQGIITTSRLVKDVYYVAYADHGYNNKEELEPVAVDFFFDQGSAKLKTQEMKGKAGKDLDAFIASNNVTRTVTIVGRHSPEGSEAKNSKLADDRAVSIEKYYKERMKHFNKKGAVDSIKFVTKGVFQDWTSLKKEFETSTVLTDAQESQVLSIIDGPGSFIEKEKKLAKLPFYKTMLTKVYPHLRVAKTEILKVKPKKSNAELAVLAKGICEGRYKLDTLTKEELSYAATLTPILSEREAIYKALIKKSDSWDAYNNLGAVYLEMAAKETDKDKKKKLAEQAMTNLEIAVKKEKRAEAYTNLATAQLMRGNRKEAMAFTKDASDSSPSDEVRKGIMGIKGCLNIKDGNYTEAVQNLSRAHETNEVNFDIALANLLMKSYDPAKKGFDRLNSSNPNDAWGWYLAAITAARQKDEGAMTANLKKAVKLDSKLIDKALSDMEFYNYWNSQNFKDALK